MVIEGAAKITALNSAVDEIRFTGCLHYTWMVSPGGKPVLGYPSLCGNTSQGRSAISGILYQSSI
jgi:hypothetical protein